MHLGFLRDAQGGKGRLRDVEHHHVHTKNIRKDVARELLPATEVCLLTGDAEPGYHVGLDLALLQTEELLAKHRPLLWRRAAHVPAKLEAVQRVLPLHLDGGQGAGQ